MVVMVSVWVCQMHIIYGQMLFFCCTKCHFTMSKNWEVHDIKRLIVEYKKDQLGLHKVC